MYSIGVDYGTLSGRALLVDLETGEEIATSVFEYPHAVMNEYLPDGETKLDMDFALQHPKDYLDVLSHIIPDVLEQGGVSVDQVVGVGIDFTACTVLPILEDGTPLCALEEFKCNPHAYVKLWKHHAAQTEANRLNEIATKRGEAFLARYGGKISSEWLFPKIWETLNKAPEVYEKADKFIEATDWVVMMLCGNEARSSCTAGYKAVWSKKDGYPSKEFFAALDPRLENVIEEKLSLEVASVGSKAGEITPAAAKVTSLAVGTAVAVGHIDAHAAMPALGISRAGKMMIIVGTSSCHLLMGNEERVVPGICGYAGDGILPGFVGYEAGQSCVGDHFDWFVKNCVPEHYIDQAKLRNISIHQLLREKAQVQKAGQSGLLALDWWNGNRSVLTDVDLSGVMIGMTLLTKPEEIYRALIEATAFGTKVIIDNFEKHGITVDEIYAAGGIADKDAMMMQIYADVTGREIRIGKSAQAPALGSAILGAVAAGADKGGYDTIDQAAAALGGVKDVVYMPNAQEHETYKVLYQEYLRLHDYFGRGENNVLKNLKAIKEKTRS